MKLSVVANNVQTQTEDVSGVPELVEIILNSDYSLGTFRNNHRNLKNFEGADAIALDIDGGLDIDTAAELFKEYKHIIAPTRSHRKDKGGVVADRFRIILFLSRTIVDPAEYTGTWRALHALCPQADEACKDASRMFYASSDVYHVNENGKLVEPVKPFLEAMQVVTPLPDGERGTLNPRTCRFMVMGAQVGKRHPEIYQAAMNYKQNGYTLAEFLRDMNSMVDRVQPKNWDRQKADSTAVDAFSRDVKYEAEVQDRAFKFMNARELLTADLQFNWIVDNLLSEGGFSIIAGPPKSGKSTLTRQLARAICRGDVYLGRQCVKGTVLYLALEEQVELLQADFKRLGITENDSIYVHVGGAQGVNIIGDLTAAIGEIQPTLVVIDTLFLFAQVKNQNDYQEVNAALAKIRAIARETKAHIICVHHTVKPSKDGARSGAATILGSTAIHGAVDNAITIAMVGDQRFITTSQRGGKRFLDHELIFDNKSLTYIVGEQKDGF